jgi:uncharacterized protein (DUF433 family)
MRLEDYLDFLAPDVIRLRGHRIGLEHVVEAHKEGETPEQIAAYYKSIPLEQIYAVIAYYLRNRDDVEAYLARVNAAVAARERAQQPSAVMRRIQATIEGRRQQTEPSGDEAQISP